MCFLCDARGDGMIWYKNPRNYGRRMYKRREPGGKPVEVVGRAGAYEADTKRMLKEALETKCAGDIERYRELIRRMEEIRAEEGSTTQVLPLRDCFDVVDIATPVTKLACICRKYTRALEENEKTFSCMGLGQAQFKWERWPERYRNGVIFMSPDEAKEWLTYWDKRGMVHVVMNYMGQIGGICNCDYPDCYPLRHRLDYDLKNAMIKGEYVAKVDYDVCNGCGDCAQRCQFGAIKMEVTTNKVNIDMMRCFGCGLCETGCSCSAITLVDRKAMPALKEVW